MQDELLQIFCSVLYGGVTAKEACRILLRNQIVNKLDAFQLEGCAIYEFLVGVARCAGYKPLQN